MPVNIFASERWFVRSKQAIDATYQKQKKTIIMGRFISYGIVYQYVISKAELEERYHRAFHTEKPMSEFKQEIINQMFPQIYRWEEDDAYLYFFIRDSYTGDDIIEIMKAFYDIHGYGEDYMEELSPVFSYLKGATIDDAVKTMKENPSYLFQNVSMGFVYSPFAIPFKLNGRKIYISVHVELMMIEMAQFKTLTEDDAESYDFFTYLLRYRMKPNKLADAMLVFLST